MSGLGPQSLGPWDGVGIRRYGRDTDAEGLCAGTPS